MNSASIHRGYRCLPDVIAYAVWLYHLFARCGRDVEDMLARLGVMVSNEAVRQWSARLGLLFVGCIKSRLGGEVVDVTTRKRGVTLRFSHRSVG